MLALYPEPFTVLAGAGAGIARLSDLRGRRVSIGPVGSGGRATMTAVMRELGWTDGDFAHLADLATADLGPALCRGDIDAAVLVIAHPNLAVEEIVGACDVVLAAVDPGIARDLAARHPDHFPHAIPAGTQAGQTAGVDVFALPATLVTSSRVRPSIVRHVARSVIAGLPALRESHPAFAEFGPRECSPRD